MLPLKVTKIDLIYSGGETLTTIVLTVTATDADMRTAMSMVTMKRNNAPTRDTDIEAPWSVYRKGPN